jgi:hypothetical protein
VQGHFPRARYIEPGVGRFPCSTCNKVDLHGATSLLITWPLLPPLSFSSSLRCLMIGGRGLWWQWQAAEAREGHWWVAGSGTGLLCTPLDISGPGRAVACGAGRWYPARVVTLPLSLSSPCRRRSRHRLDARDGRKRAVAVVVGGGGLWWVLVGQRGQPLCALVCVDARRLALFDQGGWWCVMWGGGAVWGDWCVVQSGDVQCTCGPWWASVCLGGHGQQRPW